MTELRSSRSTAGISQRQLAKELGCGQAEISRLECLVGDLTLTRLSEWAALLGLSLAASLHPAGEPIRDVAQTKLIGRFQKILASIWIVALEAPFPTLGDLRSWDVFIRLGSAFRVGVEAETRVRDQQELVRRIRQRELHGGADEILLILSDTAHNRRLAGELRDALGPRYSTSPSAIVAAIRAGRPLPGSGVILL
jgi:transcriptional regulator with XRE-family HTH domain